MNLRSAKQGKSEKLTISTTALGLTALKIKPTPESMIGATSAFITFEDTVRFTLDGTTPVAATKIGHQWFGGTPLQLDGEQNLLALRMVREGGTDVVAYVTYF